jgi:mono/diheme cytochrome c family protein
MASNSWRGPGPALRAALVLAAAALGALGPAAVRAAADEERLTNPRLGDPAAIEEGRSFYRTRCVICHGSNGGRGPNLFATPLDDQGFLYVVIQGRRSMPAFGLRMSPDDVWAVHAYVRSTDHYE